MPGILEHISNIKKKDLESVEGSGFDDFLTAGFNKKADHPSSDIIWLGTEEEKQEFIRSCK